MNSMIKFEVLGRLTKDPEVKELESGKKVCNFTLAVDRDYKDKENNKITDFFDFALWNKEAEKIKKFSKQGASIYMTGTLETEYVEIDGKKIKMLIPSVDKYKHIANKKDLITEPIEETKNEEVVK